MVRLRSGPRAGRDAVEAEGFRFLDLTPELAACAEEGEVALDALHPSVLGHRCADESLARQLEAAIPPAVREPPPAG